MSTREGGLRSQELEPVLEQARSLDGAVADDVHRAGREAVLDQVRERAERRRRGMRLGVGALATTAAAAATVAIVLLSQSPEPLAYESEGGPPSASGWIDASHVDRSARFVDGTRFHFDQGTRGRITDRTRQGASVWLDQGVVHADVVPGGEWRVVAGPYTVEVIGTVFAVHWSSAERELRVVLHRGTVVVRGTGFESGITLRAGQTLWASSDDAELEVRDTAAEPTASGEPDPPQTGVSEDGPSPPVEGAEAEAAAADEDAAAAADRTEAGRSRRNRRSSRAPSSSPSESLESLAAAGRYAEVYERARERGMDQLLAQGPLEEVVALADAARYTGRTRLAADALGAQRERFPRSGPGRLASFLLGRLAEERQGDAGAALRWYGTYLRESPRGPLAVEALGRRMLLEQASGRDGAARRSARAYLERHPTGPHASTARRLREVESSALP